MSLEELFKGRGIDLPSSMGHLKKVAAELGLPWGMRTRTCNSRRAQELGKWAEALGKGDEFHMAVFQAYFADGRNIADISVLKEIAGTIGLDGRMAKQALAERTFKEAVDHDWEYSRTCGITAVPTFMVDGRKVVGAQPYQALEDLVTAAGGIRGNDGRSLVSRVLSDKLHLDVVFSHVPFDDAKYIVDKLR